MTTTMSIARSSSVGKGVLLGRFAIVRSPYRVAKLRKLRNFVKPRASALDAKSAREGLRSSPV